MKAIRIKKHLFYGAFLLLVVFGVRFFKGGSSSDGSKNNLGIVTMSNRTYGMIKPEAVQNRNTGKIIDRIESEGFSIVAMKKMHMTKDLAEQFYAVHKEKPFFGELVESIASGPIVAFVLEKDDAITAWRELMGATNPADAAEGTLRKLYGTSIGNNATHGSDAPETAAAEIKLIFPELG